MFLYIVQCLWFLIGFSHKRLVSCPANFCVSRPGSVFASSSFYSRFTLVEKEIYREKDRKRSLIDPSMYYLIIIGPFNGLFDISSTPSMESSFFDPFHGLLDSSTTLSMESWIPHRPYVCTKKYQNIFFFLFKDRNSFMLCLCYCFLIRFKFVSCSILNSFSGLGVSVRIMIIKKTTS